MTSRIKDIQENYFGNVPTAQFFVRYENGKFYDIELEEEINIKDKALLQIKTNRFNIDDKIYDKITNQQEKKILPSGTKLYFHLLLKNGTIKFVLVLDEDLILTKKNNKLSKVKSCRFSIVEMDGTQIKEDVVYKGNSLNQAYFQMSKKFNPENRSHVCNVYKTFRTLDGEYIERFRF